MRLIRLYIVIIFLLTPLTQGCATMEEKLKDDFIHLEDIDSKENMDWVKTQNALSKKKVESLKNYQSNFDFALNQLNDKEKIPYFSIFENHIENFWRDEKNVRGLWRKTTLENYQSKNTKWETILDFDELAKKEDKNWVYKGSVSLEEKPELALVMLSDGGKDALEIREFNKKTKQFVKDGFFIPEAKSRFSWRDEDHIFIATDFGEGSATNSGYPRVVKFLKRGQKLDEAIVIAETKKEYNSAGTYRVNAETKKYDIFYESINFYEFYSYFINADNSLTKINIPKKSNIITITDNHMLLLLEEDWEVNNTQFTANTLLSIELSHDKGTQLKLSTVKKIYQPDNKSSALSYRKLKDYILINELNNIKGQIKYFNLKNFEVKTLDLHANAHLEVMASSKKKNIFTYTIENFNKPRTFGFYNFDKSKDHLLKQLKDKFNAQDVEVRQQWVKSKDGTLIPYFLVGKKDVLEKGNAPTELYGYGGFNVTLTPYYSQFIGKLWLEKGGVYVLSNIRGGGEFGVEWHQSAILENKQKSYDDFIAIAEDLIAQKITSPKKLAISGGSNGGLLVGAVMTQRPDLFGFVYCGVPLLDMMRYHKLLAGASWMAEYGNPDIPEQRKTILKYSPYQNLKKDTKYPTVLFFTSTKDDRVHPGHARKMFAKMKSMNIPNLHYYENIDGGHAGAANNKETAFKVALKYTLMADVLGLTD